MNWCHYCGACGKSFCSLCTVNKAKLPYDPTQKQKVCDSCYQRCTENDIEVYRPSPRIGQAKPDTPQALDSSAPSQTVMSNNNGSTQPNKDKDLDDGFNKQPLKVHQVTEELPKVIYENCSKNKSTVMVYPHCHEKSENKGDLQSNEETTV